jgi:2-polyprenyl-3-methyl-5-hydroxy-6-metoxy-1,4-benzoquinol methylase
MEIKTRLKLIAKGVINLFKDKESVYYEKLFINNSYWNSKDGNEDERARWKVIEELINSHVKENKSIKILDLGCGRGWLSNLLTEFGFVTGAEPVKGVVKYAKKMYPKVEFVVGSTKELIKNGTKNFNLIVCSEVLEHIPDDKKNEFIGEIHQLLATGGYAIFSTPRAEAQEDWLKNSKITQPIEEWISENDLEKLFSQNSFKSKELKRVELSPVPGGELIPIYQVWLFTKI